MRILDNNPLQRKGSQSLNTSFHEHWNNLREKQETLKEIDQLLEIKRTILKELEDQIDHDKIQSLSATRIKKNSIKAPNLEEIRKESYQKSNKTKIKWK